MGIESIRRYAELTRNGRDPDGSKKLRMLVEHRDEVRQRIDRLGEHLEILERKVAAGCQPSDSSL